MSWLDSIFFGTPGPPGPPGPAGTSNANIWLPTAYGLGAWNYDPAFTTGSSTFASGVPQVVRLQINSAITITNILVGCQGAGSGVTHCYGALYNSSGSLLAQSSDLVGSLATGLITFPLSSPQAVAPGFVYAYFWAITGSTMPSFLCLTNSVTAAVANNGVFRFATDSSAPVTTAPSTLGSLSSTSLRFWVGTS